MNLFQPMPENRLAQFDSQEFSVNVLGEESPFQYAFETRLLPSGREQITIRMRSEAPARPPRVYLMWQFPQVDTHLLWHSACGHRRSIPPNWAAQGVHSKSSRNAPVLSLYSLSGENRLTFALADALNPAFLGAGVSEETGTIDCAVVLFTETTAPFTSYETSLYIDRRALPFHRVLADAAELWAGLGGYTPAPVPEHARLPMYSSWYSYHQVLDPAALEAECQLAKQLGMEAIIVDDGWQTTDNARGYAYCGDWEVTPEKFPDFKAHVARVHALGLKYVLWFSVPFVGVHSKAYERFQGMFLDPESATHGWHTLDPRFPQVREYLVELYKSFITRYDIDGFKLDFIDSFVLRPETEHSTGGGRDMDSLAEAVDRLLTDVTAALRALKPEVLIEFRQAYIGPVMRKYGNMLRAGDVPNDFHGNRIGTVDVRLLAAETAVHADMVMWHPADSVESAAMQLVHTLFAVPQVSVRLAEIPEAHRRMVAFYLRFWREQRDVLLDGTFLPEEPGALYPVVQAVTKTRHLAACYSGRLVDLKGDMPQEIFVVNGTLNEELVIHFSDDPGARKLEIWDCQGELLQELEMDFYAEPYMIAIPPAGVLKLTEIKA
ncbi:MAG: alpha-galactosidase [Anaerolineae bacterium]|nr:alpha-galactosidase [Anaerolineae bacterium]